MFKRNFKKLAGIVAMLVIVNMLTVMPVQAVDIQTVTGIVTDLYSGRAISGVDITSTKKGKPKNNYDTDTSKGNGGYSVEIHNGAGYIRVTKADGYDSYSTSMDDFKQYYSINTAIKDVINPNNTVINIKLKSTSNVSVGVSINVTDSSNQIIEPYVNTAGRTSDTIFSSPVKLATDAKAKITYGFNDVTFSKYKFVQASDLISVPDFPEDSAMTNIPLPEPNTSDAYKDDIGKQNFLTTKHYEYAGKAGTASARNVSFGTPSFEGVFEQEAITDRVKYDLGNTNGSNFYVSQNSNGNNTSYGSALNNPTSTTIPYNGKYYPKTKYASWKAMKMWGYFVPQQTGSYKLGSWSDDGAYGYIIKDGVQQVFVDDWSLQAPFNRTKNTSMDLTAGKYYPIYMEWYEGCPTQAAFVPEYQFSKTGVPNTFSSFVPIPENELYSSKTTTPGDIAGAYFGDVSGISFPAQDGIYYVATKFVSKEGITSGLYGPFVIDNTKPELNNLVVTSNNTNGNKWAVAGNTLTTKFTSSENLNGNPQILINGYVTNATITKDAQNNYTATVDIESDGSINSNKDKLTDGLITVQVAHYADLYGNEGATVQDSTVTYDNTAPTVAITYSANPTSIGTEVITVTYSEPVKAGETPKISINQQGTTDITAQNMMVGIDRTTWTYDYIVNGDNGSTYKDGIATVNLSAVHDAAGNLATVPTGSTFTVNTKALTVTLTYSANPVSVGTESITATYSKPVISGEIPNISINQQGTTDITAQPMTLVGTDRTTWTYDYTVNRDNGSTYKDGVATVTLSTVHDALNNIAVAPLVNTFTIDTKPPTVILTYSANPVKAGAEIITATYSEPVKVNEISQISINQQGSIDIASQPMTLVGTDRTVWTYDYTVNNHNGNTYKDGVATVSLVAQDAAGNIATTPSENTFTIDTIAPSLTIGMPSSTFTKSGPITYTVTYSGADKVTLNSSNVTLVKIGSADGTVTASGTGNTRTVTVSNITGDGTLGIKIAAGTATDTAGNSAIAPSDSITFEVWNSPPTITLTPSPTNLTNTDVIITVAADAVGTGNAVVEEKWLSGTQTLVDFIGLAGTVLSGNTISVSENGDYTVYARDTVGNESVKTINIGNIDKVAPELTITDPIMVDNKINSTEQNDVTISGTTEPNTVVKVVITDATGKKVEKTVTADATGNYTVSGMDVSGLAEGKLIVIATATDVAGNTSTVNKDVTKNTTAAITINDPIMVDNKINNEEKNKVTISGTTEPNTEVKVVITDSNVKTVEKTGTTGATGNYTVSEIDVSGLAEGNLAITATVTNGTGNTSTVSKNVTKDTIAPTTPTLSADITTLINRNVTVTITYPNDAYIKEYKIGTLGEWLLCTGSVIVDTNCTIYARCQDEAGNISNEGSIVVTNVDKSIIKTGLFINNKFSVQNSVSIVKGFNTNLAVEITNLKNQDFKLEMNDTEAIKISEYIKISDIKVYTTSDLKNPIDTVEITASGNTFTIKNLTNASNNYVFVLKATALKITVVPITNVIKVNDFKRPEKHTINIVKLPPLQ